MKSMWLAIMVLMLTATVMPTAMLMLTGMATVMPTVTAIRR